jgi:hypothetical protein
MPGTFQLLLDTTGPQGVTLVLDTGNPAYSTDLVVDAILATTDPDTTGYQVKLWGDVAGVPDEATAAWQTLTPAVAVTLTAGDGVKNVSARLRDDVFNTSSVATDSIVVDTTAPTIVISSGPAPTKISKNATKDTSSITWSSDSDIQAYKVKVVASTGSLESTGTQIPTTAGSTNVSGGAKGAGVAVTTSIKGADLEAASSGDGTKQVKIFVQDLAGNWSVA